MKEYTSNIEELTLKNENFREVLYTSENMQLVLMSLLPKEDIGKEIHHLDQFFRIEKGTGKAIINDNEYELSDGVVVIVPSGAMHNIINTSSTEKLKLYTIYAPKNHPDGTIHKTKLEAEKDEHH
ncbi:MAG: cupin domain-containing protein [Candidatus Paceibacterota bacterium]|jgi:mannose-6-phosphate isomerase-like protein (cupin superfamily)